MAETSSDSYTFVQSGVLLKKCPSCYIEHIQQVGNLYITEQQHDGSTPIKYIEWKPNVDVLIDTETQDQEWAVVNTIQHRRSPQCNTEQLSKYIKFKLSEVHSFKMSKKQDCMTFMDGSSEATYEFLFQHGNCSGLFAALSSIATVIPTKRRNVYLLNTEVPLIQKSFRDFNPFEEQQSNYLFGLVNSIASRPYEAAREAVSIITEIVATGPHVDLDEEKQRILQESVTTLENLPNRSNEDYELINRNTPTPPALPERKDYPRGQPLNLVQWKDLQDTDEKLEDIDYTKLHIFRGGVAPDLRRTLFPYLLNYYPWNSTRSEREAIKKAKYEEYNIMKRQWKTFTKTQEENFAEFANRKSLIEKDVNRTDRTFPFYAGENNPNLTTLNDILMTYLMYNFDIGYVQGMSDLLSPILYIMRNEVDAFWCFAGFMNKIGNNFEMDQLDIKGQLQNLYTLVSFLDPALGKHLKQHESSNMFFCFRWVLIWFKRELNMNDLLRLWEVLWTGLPCENFHLLICTAILLTERDALIEHACGFTEILRHINDLSGKLDINSILNTAEGIYNQLLEAEHLNNAIRVIIGLPTTSSIQSSANYDTEIVSSADAAADPEVDYLCDAGLVNSYL